MFNREIGANGTIGERFVPRTLYENIVPNHTVHQVLLPDCVLKKFSLDGNYLLCFSQSLHEIQVYRFKGFPVQDDKLLPQNIFLSFFQLLYEKTLSYNEDFLCQDFCLLTECGKYALFASTLKTDLPVLFHSHFTDLQDFTFYVVALANGDIKHKLSFKNDFVHLTHNSGVSLFEDLLAILSLQTQTIHIFHIKGNGVLVAVRKIGTYCYDDDEYFERHMRSVAGDMTEQWGKYSTQERCVTVTREEEGMSEMEVSETSSSSGSGGGSGSSGGGVYFGGLKQRVLSYLFQQAKLSNTLPQFFSAFSLYSAMVIWKVQFLDALHLLIKFGGIEGIQGKGEGTQRFVYLVVYNMRTTEIVTVFPNADPEVTQCLQKHWSFYRVCPTAFNAHSNTSLRDYLFPRNATQAQNMERLLAILPLSPQIWHESPYFDQSLFVYDERIISTIDRPRPCVEYPIKFYSRATGELRFKLLPGPPDSLDFTKQRIASYIFHPSFPFVISLQHTLFLPVPYVNFHFRKAT